MKKKLVILLMVATMLVGSVAATISYNKTLVNYGELIDCITGEYYDTINGYEISGLTVDETVAKFINDKNANPLASQRLSGYENFKMSNDDYGNYFIVCRGQSTIEARRIWNYTLNPFVTYPYDIDTSDADMKFIFWDKADISVSPMVINNLTGAIETIAKYESIDDAIRRISNNLTFHIINGQDAVYDEWEIFKTPLNEDVVAEVTNAFVAGYTANNPDIAAIYGNDVNALKAHWETSGRSEGRKIYRPEL